MDNALKLLPGHQYVVKKAFVDYDGILHDVGELWIYEGTNFLPYEDGLTLHVLLWNEPHVYRLQWREEAQASIIDNFKDYVEEYNKHRHQL